MHATVFSTFPQANLDFGDYGFTIQDVDHSANNLDQTINMLSFVNKPSPNKKTLANPTFSFVRTLILSICKDTGYRRNLFDTKFKDIKGLSSDLMIEFVKKILRILD